MLIPIAVAETDVLKSLPLSSQQSKPQRLFYLFL